MSGPQELMQQWTDDFMDIYNRYPSKETLTDWEIKISMMYSEEDYE